jgi:hypothetical protein
LEAHVILLSGGKDKQGSPMKHVSWPMTSVPATE